MNDSIYGDAQAPQAKVKAPSLIDQIEGVFTAPKALFEKLREAPSWVPALALAIVIGIFSSLVWAAHVDMAAQTARKMDVMVETFHANIPQNAIDDAISKADGTHPWISSVLGPLFGTFIMYLLIALITWAFAFAGRKDEKTPPTFHQAMSAVSVHYLVTLPSMLLGGLICLFKPVGGRSIQEMMPTILTYFVRPESALLRGLAFCVDPLWIFSFFVLAVAMKETLNAKTWAVASCLGVFAVFGIAFRFMGALFF